MDVVDVAAVVPPRTFPPHPVASYRSLLVITLFALMALLALAAPIDHDEDQYVAAVMLTAKFRPFADFLMLQTPLQAYVAAPLLALFPGWSLVALREANAALAAGLIILTGLVARSAGAERRVSLLAGLMTLSSSAFLFSASVFRNDMLPAVLAAASMLAVLHALKQERGSRAWLTAGLAGGLAASAKVSYAMPLAGTALFLAGYLLGKRRDSFLPVTIPFLAGAMLGLAPMAFVMARAPAQAWYGIIQYALMAPGEWYQLNGSGWMMSSWHTARVALATLLSGPALLALILVLRGTPGDRHDRPRGSARAYLLVMTAANFLAAVMPMPSREQYYVPLLLPLFALFALDLSAARRRSQRLGWAIAAFMAAGLTPRLLILAGALGSNQWPALAATAESHWVGREIRRAGLNGPLATLNARLVVDSGLPLDRRFATGAFFYRTGDSVPDRDQAMMHVVSPRTMGRSLDIDPPAAILTGYENSHNVDRIGLDGPLSRYAQTHGYRQIRSPFGSASLFERRVI